MRKNTCHFYSYLILLATVSGTFVFAQDYALRDIPDPAILQAGDGYVIFTTGAGIPICRSDDLVHWQKSGRVFAKKVPDWAKEKVPDTHGIWAPDIALYNGWYRLYYAVSSLGSQRSCIGLALNRTLDPNHPDYEWVDRGLVIESNTGTCDYNAIDPAFFADRDGKCWLAFGSFWSGIKLVELNPATGKPDGAEPKIYSLARRPVEQAIEAPFMVYRDGFYYLFVSYDHTMNGLDSNYKVMVGRAEKITGPYLDYTGRPMTEGYASLVLANHDNWRGPGHNSILRTDKGDYLVHHTWDTRDVKLGRALQIRPLYWPADGWPLAGEPVTESPKKLEPMWTEDLSGVWLHSVDYGPEYPLTFGTDGNITGSGVTGKWQKLGEQVILQFPDAKEPGKVWEDRCLLLSPYGFYIGRNQNGQVIRGYKE
mgnify:CR=1 FL=1